MTGVGEAGNAVSLPFGVIRPCWLIATGDTERLGVLRSPLVTDTSRMYETVRRFIGHHGLVLAAQDTFEDTDWMFGRVEMSVYATPTARNASYAEVLA